MPAPSNLPTERVTVRFPPVEAIEESYQLLELPAEILKAVEGGEVVPLTIKGRPNDDAVLCTESKTWTLRTVSISNSLMILRPPTHAHSDPTLQIRDVCHEVLECVPSAARTERLRGVLRESAWSGLSKQTPRKRKRDDAKRYTLSQLQSIIQASDSELAAALREVNAVEVDGDMMLFPPVELAELISVILKLVTVHGDSQDKSATTCPCPAAEMFAGLSEYDVDASITAAVMRLFGSVESEIWTADVRRMVRELGHGLLVGIKDKPQPIDDFMSTWEKEAGDEWAHHIDLPLLSGSYLLTDPPPSAFAAPCQIIRYFPTHTLTTHVATRFSDLFLTRPRWRPDEMSPFLRGLHPEGDTKARDKLIAKFVRVVKEKDGAWWYPRRTG